MAAPLTYEQLITDVAERHGDMSRRFQQIARFVVQNPNDVALETAKTIGRAAGVQPSTLVRFAQSFGYAGFSEMQRVFQSRLLTAAPGFNDRMSALKKELGRKAKTTHLAALHDLVVGDGAALQHLLDTVTEENLAEGAALLADARVIYVLGQLRAYPVASYLGYVLTHLRRDVRMIDGAGGLAAEQAQLMDKDCVLLAVSFRHYAREVVDIVEAADQRGVPIVAITDTQLSPLAKHATVAFEVAEGEFNFSRSLAAPMCLAQTLAIGMARVLEKEPRRQRKSKPGLG